MFLSTSFADWTLMSTNKKGNNFYVDFEKIKKYDGYVYYWILDDLLIPDKDGDLSYLLYHQGDCKLFRYKTLSEEYYKQQKGRGDGVTNAPKNQEWTYPIPKSSLEIILKSICSR